MSDNNFTPGADNHYNHKSGYKVNNVSSGIITNKVELDYVALQPKLGWVTIDVARKTLECTT